MVAQNHLEGGLAPSSGGQEHMQAPVYIIFKKTTVYIIFKKIYYSLKPTITPLILNWSDSRYPCVRPSYTARILLP